MAEIHLIRRPGGIVDPVGPDDAAAWGAVELDQVFTATIRKPRNSKFHRFAWAMVTVAADNWPGDSNPTPAQVMRWLKLKTGLVDIEPNPDTGVMEVWPKSIRFDAMSEDEFHPWFHDLALPAVAAHLGITIEQLTGEMRELPVTAHKTYKLKGAT
jgi:hypothetical protein